jgi:hypothetical protein
MADKTKLIPFPNGGGAAARGGGVDNGGGPPHDKDMEPRIAKLEEFATDARERLVRIETRLDQTATKADLQEGLLSVIKWIVGTAAVLVAMAITVMTFVLNNAVPKAPAAQPAPIIIQVPAAPAATVAPPPQK